VSQSWHNQVEPQKPQQACQGAAEDHQVDNLADQKWISVPEVSAFPKGHVAAQSVSEGAGNSGSVVADSGAVVGGELPSGHYTLEPEGTALVTERIAVDPLLGRSVADRFLLLSVLGEGGVGKVYLAEQQPLGRKVAVKLLHAQSALRKESRQRFQREAVSMNRISHPGLTAIYDFGEWDGQFFIAMELLKGRSLYNWLYQKFPISTEQIVSILSQVCDALLVAHTAGLVHRDLKPENIMVDSDHRGELRAKVVDWGLVLLREEDTNQRLTSEGSTVGTPFYMAPEQCQGRSVDARTDIYALGTILYEMLCGKTPFEGGSHLALMMQQLVAQPEPPSTRNPRLQISPVLEELALRSLSKAPEQRPQSAEQFREQLMSALQESELPRAQNIAVQTMTRAQRAEAMGLPQVLSKHIIRAPTAFAEHVFLVVERVNHYQESTIMQMWANGFTVKHCASIHEAIAEIEQLQPVGIAVDLSPDPEPLFSTLQRVLQAEVLQQKSIPIMVIGPDDSFDLMTRCLTSGIFDYIPISQLAQKLPKSFRRAIRMQTRH
jgi:serine/threonine protein kinase